MQHLLKTVAQNNFFDYETFRDYAIDYHADRISDDMHTVSTWWLNDIVADYRTFRGNKMIEERARNVEKNNEYLRTCY